MLYFAVCLFLAVASAADVRDLCPRIKPQKKDASIFSDTLWMVVATNLTVLEFGIKDEPACDCFGFVFPKVTKDSSITSCNASTFSCNVGPKSGTYSKEDWFISLVDETQPWSVYYITTKADGKSYVISFLDTGNHNTFSIMYYCGVYSADGAPLLMVLTKDKAGLTWKEKLRVNEVLKQNNFRGPLMTYNTKYCIDVE